jgi:GNAT superfamily N-acetyltransferase
MILTRRTSLCYTAPRNVAEDVRFDWRTFTPVGGDFGAYLRDGHLLAAFGAGPEVSDRARELGQIRHAECFALYPLVGFIDEISVQPDQRDQGTGSRLLAAAITKFRELGVAAVFLRAVPEKPEWLIRLLRFYWRFGFDIAPECTERDDASLTLRLILDSER